MTDGIRKVLNPLEVARRLHKLLMPANLRFIEENTGKKQHGTSIITFSVIHIQNLFNFSEKIDLS